MDRGPQAGTDTFAGSYFYGQRHNIPNDTLVSNHIHNKKTYCIPDIEPYIDEPAERSKRSVAWLRAVMVECKKVGMTIEFSFEPRDTSMTIANTLKTCDDIMREYPQIDDLELMTEETGKWSNKPAYANEIKQIIKTHFDAEIIKEEPSLYNFQTEQDPSQVTTAKQPNIDRDYLNLLAELGHNIKAVKELDTLRKYKNLKINLGIYCVVPGYLKACLLLMNRFVPKDIQYSILPAHSAQRVANYVHEVGIDKNVWQRSMLYSWIEFDGLMYLKENGITGIKMLVQEGQNVMQGTSIPGICFNHWRTS